MYEFELHLTAVYEKEANLLLSTQQCSTKQVFRGFKI